MSKKIKLRKLSGEANLPHSAFSRKLRRASELLGEGKREDALQLLSSLTQSAKNDIERSKIANLVGKSQYELGRYADAAERFKYAAELGASDGLDQKRYLAPSLGRIRCLLKGQKGEEALEVAEGLSALVKSKYKRYREVLAGSNIAVVEVPAKPIRPAVALTRIGVTFLEEGYLENGKSFLERVVAEVPNGASRARQFLARALIQLGDYESAEVLAAESLKMGGFKAKTVPSWEFLIRARKAQGKDLLDLDLYRKFRGSLISGRVKARADLLIIGELRRHGDPLWFQLAERWRSSSDIDSIAKTEILKLLVSEIKAGTLYGDNRGENALEISREIYSQRTLSAGESVSLAKTLGEFGPDEGLSAEQIQVWLRRISRRFGPQYGFRAMHACALGMSENRNFQAARELFELLISRASEKSDHWGKAVWSLAKLESSDNNPEGSAALYLKYAGNQAFKPQSRLQAFLRWLKEAERSGAEVDITNARRDISILLSDINDYRPLLDAGRQLSLAGSRFDEVLSQVVERAEVRSLAAFDDATTTREALVVLIALSRRNFYDFGRKDRVIDIHEQMSGEKLNWLWSHDARFWEYLSIVMRSYFRSNRVESGTQLGQMVFTNKEIPSVGLVFLGVHYSEWLLQRGRVTEAAELFEMVIEEHPRHRLTSRAYYWLALRLYKQGKRLEAGELLTKARKCLQPRPALLSEWQIDAKSGLLLRSVFLDERKIDLGIYSDDFLDQQNESLLRDIAGAAI